ncbi:MAG: NAD-dependent epimerase/dehydratase family protein [Alphaproteobacteria bacterium]
MEKSHNSPKIAITGATGYLGQFIVAHLLKQNIKVTALTRNINKAKTIFPHVEWVEGELSPTANYSQLFDGCHGLIHGAFHHIKGRYRGGEGDDLEGFYQKNIAGSHNLLEQAKDLHYGVFISSRAVYGDVHNMAEDAPPQPDSHYGIYKDKVEKLIIQHHYPLAIIRPTGVYGIINPMNHSKWYGLIEAIKYNKVYPTPHQGTEVHGDDLAKAISLLLAPQYHGQIFNCSDFMMSHRKIGEILNGLYALNAPLPQISTRKIFAMPTHKLQAIGWQPSGQKLLKATLKTIYEAI